MKRVLALFFFLIFYSLAYKASSGDKAFNYAHAQENELATTQIVILGVGTPNADPDCSGSSIAIIVNEIPYIVDFGPGVVRQASAAYLAGVKGLALQNLKRAFLTHFHSDHTAGYPDLILTPWIMGRNEPLEVYGPSGTHSMTYHLLRAYKSGIKMRLEGLEPANRQGCRVLAYDIEKGYVYQDANVRVKAFPVKHGSFQYAFGYRFETPDKTIVISGDTAPVDTIIENARGCDVLIHEVYSEAWFEKLNPAWQKYHAAFHTSSRQLVEIAEKTKPGLLILYHQLFKGGTTEEGLLDEIKKTYKGKVVFAHDLDIF